MLDLRSLNADEADLRWAVVKLCKKGIYELGWKQIQIVVPTRGEVDPLLNVMQHEFRDSYRVIGMKSGDTDEERVALRITPRLNIQNLHEPR